MGGGEGGRWDGAGARVGAGTAWHGRRGAFREAADGEMAWHGGDEAAACRRATES